MRAPCGVLVTSACVNLPFSKEDNFSGISCVLTENKNAHGSSKDKDRSGEMAAM